jgi:hypothetical protein
MVYYDESVVRRRSCPLRPPCTCTYLLPPTCENIDMLCQQRLAHADQTSPLIILPHPHLLRR